ncbi:MAG TPA: hypothetical protein ENK82_01020 [Campylobacterales bacterium]|nr:hypothetical protein [Campylobacterales bacterium]HHS91906.1 hypothetical protein [Campylobacterales bacterium]
MVEYGITTLQTQPSLLKKMNISKIVDKRKHQDIGYFISSKYEDMILDVIQKIEQKEKIDKLNKLKEYQDLEFIEAGVDDGLK